MKKFLAIFLLIILLFLCLGGFSQRINYEYQIDSVSTATVDSREINTVAKTGTATFKFGKDSSSLLVIETERVTKTYRVDTFLFRYYILDTLHGNPYPIAIIKAMKIVDEYSLGYTLLLSTDMRGNLLLISLERGGYIIMFSIRQKPKK